MNSVDFLLGVWGKQCEPGDHVCLSAKGSSWRDYSFPYDDGLRENLSDWLEANAKKDMYFCPLPFSSAKRAKDGVLRSKFLWSDIDEGDYSKSPPTILWQSSPGRYQGLWELPQTVEPDVAASMSKQMAYYLGGDRGGWDLTQVLRIPGTPNLKYESRPIVKLVEWSDRILKKVPQSLIERWRATIPKKIMRIIEGPVEVGKRSDMLWYLEHALCDLGIPIKDVFAILRDTDWNKYRGRDDEEERFSSEMTKIKADRGAKDIVTRVESVALTVVNYSQLMASQSSTPGWLVKDWWMRGSHGIIAGEPKSFKSTLSMDMLFSVASGTPFLGQHEVKQQGPVLIVQNENSDWIMKDRLEKLAIARGQVGSVRYRGDRLQIKWAKQVPMFFVNQQSFMLDDAANKEALEDLIDRLRPVAIQLDPLYLMFSGDVNSAKDLAPVLQWCLYIKQTYNCAVILVHHYGKGNSEKRGGQRMLGSTTLHGWIESAWYVQVHDPIEGRALLTVDREFRGSGIHSPVDLNISMSEPERDEHEDGSMSVGGSYLIEVGHPDGGDKQQEILDMLSSGAKSLREILASIPNCRASFDALVKDGQIKTDGGRRYILGDQYATR